jgi:V/A-type H+-transporting ATPase subunit E
MVPENSGVEQLAQAVLAQAKAEAKKIKATAEAAAHQLVDDAERQAKRRQEDAAVAEAARVERQNAFVLAATRLEARRRILEAREQLVDRVFTAVEQRLRAIRKDPAYPRVLTKLVDEGVSALEGETLIVAVGSEDHNIASQALSAATTAGGRIEVRADEHIHGGCVVTQSDGRALYDNSFSSILERHRPRLRALVADTLWQKQTRWDEV